MALTAEQQEKIWEKENEYMNYIIQHIQNVRKAADEVIEKLSLPQDLAEQLRGRVIDHDQSKYSDEEFDAYRRYYHSISDKEKNEAEEDYKQAEQHHYDFNSHHWNHYYNKETREAAPIPDIDITEMLADWTGMGYKFNSDAYTWYYNELKKDPKAIVLHPETKEKVEKALELLRK